MSTNFESELTSESFLNSQVNNVACIVEREAKNELKVELEEFFFRGRNERNSSEEKLYEINLNLEKCPNDIDLIRSRIKFLVNIHPEKTVDDCLRLIDLAPKDLNDDTYAIYGQVLSACRRHTESMKYIEKSLDINPSNSLALLVKSSRMEAAKSGLIEKALVQDPSNVEYLLEKVWSLRGIQPYNEAIRILEECYPNVRNGPLESKYYQCKAAIEEASSRIEDCLVSSVKSVLLEPRNLNSMVTLSLAYERMGEYDRSLEIAKLFTEFYEERMGDLDDSQKLFLANCYYNNKDFEECVSLCQETLTNQCHSCHAHRVIGYSFWFMNKIEKAIQHLEEATLIDHTDPLLFRALGLCLEQMSNLQPDNERKFLKKAGLMLYEANRLDSSIFEEARRKPENNKWREILEKLVGVFTNLIDSTDPKKMFEKVHLYHAVRNWATRLLGDHSKGYSMKTEWRMDVQDRWNFLVDESRERKKVSNILYDVSCVARKIEIPKVFLLAVL